ncbi:hypothetical protein EYF80_033712 [Liparis tanakae]|uniref:Uncharacterized protein n=1 Tax=Liparis tanakae TaxID=230148 RepID=A0A4Z2GS05_9TELE|nr:hypothetical protein EYF80_033712 [Liparis tanakae]
MCSSSPLQAAVGGRIRAAGLVFDTCGTEERGEIERAAPSNTFSSASLGRDAGQMAVQDKSTLTEHKKKEKKTSSVNIVCCCLYRFVHFVEFRLKIRGKLQISSRGVNTPRLGVKWTDSP